MQIRLPKTENDFYFGVNFLKKKNNKLNLF